MKKAILIGTTHLNLSGNTERINKLNNALLKRGVFQALMEGATMAVEYPSASGDTIDDYIESIARFHGNKVVRLDNDATEYVALKSMQETGECISKYLDSVIPVKFDITQVSIGADVSFDTAVRAIEYNTPHAIVEDVIIHDSWTQIIQAAETQSNTNLDYLKNDYHKTNYHLIKTSGFISLGSRDMLWDLPTDELVVVAVGAAHIESVKARYVQMGYEVM